MYGGIMLFREGQYDNCYYLNAKAKEALSPLSETFNEEYFIQMWQTNKPTLSVKALLATEQRIPGIGNGVIQDILFRAKINPQSKIGNLSWQEARQVFTYLKSTIREMTERGGRDTEKDLFGHYGQYQTILSSKTWPGVCPVCLSSIVRKAYLGGNVYFCPQCQPVK
jgi:formamidopyrimidine-DNA glycosylase